MDFSPASRSGSRNVPVGAGMDSLLASVGSVPVEIRAVLGQRAMRMREVLRLGRGAQIELDRQISEPIELWAGGKLFAWGEVEVINGRIAVRIVSLVSQG